MCTTLPRRYSTERDVHNLTDIHEDSPKKSFLPVKNAYSRPHYEFNVRSSSIGAEPRNDSKFLLHRRPTFGRAYKSPESSLSESARNDNSDSVSDLSTSNSRSRYSAYNNSHLNGAKAQLDNKTDNNAKKPSPSTRRVSRFLRPDFYEDQRNDASSISAPEKPEENIIVKEKKEKELETQKVLKEIRDKRKSRLNMRRSLSRDRPQNADLHAEVNKFLETKSDDHHYVNLPSNGAALPDYVNVTVAPKEKTPPPLHDYVNVKVPEISTKKDKPSKIARPKSYPAEKVDDEEPIVPVKEEVVKSKIGRLKKVVRQSSKDKDKDKDETKPEEEKSNKNKLLQSIEKKLEKFRSSNIAANKDPEEVKVLQAKKSSVESAIKRLREQSVPRNIEGTESGLIKRAVSVEEMPSNKPLQASRKSVTKILGLFKKYEEQETKKKDKVVKKKPADKEKKSKDDNSNKETVISDTSSNNNGATAGDSGQQFNQNLANNNVNVNGNGVQQEVRVELPQKEPEPEVVKKERPRSLLFNRSYYNGTRSDTNFNNPEAKVKSKLPVNHYRRSLNLDNVLPEPPKFYKNPSESNNVNNNGDRRGLRLDLGHSRSESYAPITPDDNSALMSPNDDASCDSWSVCSDLHSPLSPQGGLGSHLMHSGDEGESVIDRIRRKSFYTRFNEKKQRPRIPSLTRNYGVEVEPKVKSPGDYSSLDRRTYGSGSSGRNPVARRSSYASSLQEVPKHEYRQYQRSSSLLNDYVNMPNRYQTYSATKLKPATNLYSDVDDNHLDDYLTNKTRKFGALPSVSRLSRASPGGARYGQSSVTSPTPSDTS